MSGLSKIVDNEILAGVSNREGADPSHRKFIVSTPFLLDKVTWVSRIARRAYGINLIGNSEGSVLSGPVDAPSWISIDKEKNPLAVLFRDADSEIVGLPCAKGLDKEIWVNPRAVHDVFPPHLRENGLLYRIVSKVLPPKACVEFTNGSSVVVDALARDVRKELGRVNPNILTAQPA